MTETHDLATRLLAAIERREQAALAASPGPWTANAEHDEVVAVDGITVADGFALSNNQLRATVDFIVDNDPTAVLLHSAAHRKIVALHDQDHECPEATSSGHPVLTGWYAETPCPTLLAMAEIIGLTEQQEGQP
jgi:hypothetical protein